MVENALQAEFETAILPDVLSVSARLDGRLCKVGTVLKTSHRDGTKEVKPQSRENSAGIVGRQLCGCESRQCAFDVLQVGEDSVGEKVAAHRVNVVRQGTPPIALRRADYRIPYGNRL